MYIYIYICVLGVRLTPWVYPRIVWDTWFRDHVVDTHGELVRIKPVAN